MWGWKWTYSLVFPDYFIGEHFLVCPELRKRANHAPYVNETILSGGRSHAEIGNFDS